MKILSRTLLIVVGLLSYNISAYSSAKKNDRKSNDPVKILETVVSSNGVLEARKFSDYRIYIAFSESGLVMSSIKSHNVESFYFSDDSCFLITKLYGNGSKIYDVKTGAHLMTINNDVKPDIHIVESVVSNNGVFEAQKNSDNTLCIVCLQSGRAICDIEGSNVKSFYFSENSRFLMTELYEDGSEIYDTETGAHVMTLKSDMMLNFIFSLHL